MISRSQAAFRFSLDRLADTKRRLYFWTFTAAEALEDREFAVRWARFSRLWRAECDRRGREWSGLRCFEPHEGGGVRQGRAHAHLVIDLRMHVTELRRFAAMAGLGRVMWVRRVRVGQAGRIGAYLSKYLSKRFGLVGCRRWAAMGSKGRKGWHCKRAEVIADWPEAAEMRACYAHFRGHRGCASIVASIIAERRGFEEAGLWRDDFGFNWDKLAVLTADIRAERFRAKALVFGDWSPEPAGRHPVSTKG